MLKIHAIPNEENIVTKYSCKINGQDCPVAFARVSAVPFNRRFPGTQRALDQTEIAGFVSFEADEAITVTVTVKEPFCEAILRPQSCGIRPTVDGNTVSFSLCKPGQYSLELDGYHENLTVFYNPVRDFGMKQTDENVLYFGAGVHEIGWTELHSHQRVYIDADAVVYGGFYGFRLEDVRIAGYGVLDGSHLQRTTGGCYLFAGSHTVFSDEEIEAGVRGGKTTPSTMQLWGGKDIEVSGIIFRDSSCFTLLAAKVERLLVDCVKLIGEWRYNCDGIDLINCRNAVIENSYLRCFDDCIVLKGVEGFHDRSVENIHVRGCVVWNDWGGALEIGAETCAPEYKNILFDDIDIIHGQNDFMRIHQWDDADVHDVTYHNIRCELTSHRLPNKLQEDDAQRYEGEENSGFSDSKIIYLPINVGLYSHLKVPGRTHHIRFSDIAVFADEKCNPGDLIEIYGFDGEHFVSDVVIENFTLNGKRLTDENTVANRKFTENIVLK